MLYIKKTKSDKENVWKLTSNHDNCARREDNVISSIQSQPTATALITTTKQTINSPKNKMRM